MKYVILGGGAAGFFAALACKEKNPDAEVIILEKSLKFLAKVLVTGGGRCNLTNTCSDPKELVKFYPRGNKALLGPFYKFNSNDTKEWFEARDVSLYSQDDGRIFPESNSSQTIVNCLLKEANRLNIDLRLKTDVQNIEKIRDGFILHLEDDEKIHCDKLLITTGSALSVYPMIKDLGHTITAPIPSLFTFNTPSSDLLDLSGITLEDVVVSIKGCSLKQRGPLLLTHFGFSGPSILKLSAWGARFLYEKNYKAGLQIDWIPNVNLEKALSLLEKYKEENSSRHVSSLNPFSLPKKLWKHFAPDIRWVDFSNKAMRQLVQKLKNDLYEIDGKTTFKEEFVTCGGVNLDEVNFKTMQSKICPGLYFAGEVLDIDAETGGFNLQNAWTTSWIAGNNM